MSNMHSVSEIRPHSAEPLTLAQQEVLERAVAKIVLIGELVGVNADQMILLLESGLTVSELLEYLGARTRQAIGKRARLEVCGEGWKGD
ncbi:MAG TPA: hypothetical protein VEK84_07365 [Terriglobales bacterium]|nr:hypothetical protein [Terriglobales bacterium]